MNEPTDDALSEREQLLLRVLVGSYIRDGQPVGSRSLSRESGLALSSATIRNIVADLEQLGFVSSPHTSAGRIPTDKGYRFFVDSLLKARPPIDDDPAFEELRKKLDATNEDPKALVAVASQLLSNVTRLAGVVTLPRPQQASITQIEFLGLSDNRALVELRAAVEAHLQKRQGARPSVDQLLEQGYEALPPCLPTAVTETLQ